MVVIGTGGHAGSAAAAPGTDGGFGQRTLVGFSGPGTSPNYKGALLLGATSQPAAAPILTLPAAVLANSATMRSLQTFEWDAVPHRSCGLELDASAVSKIRPVS